MQALDIVAELMALSARTAPKSAGQDFVKIEIVRGEQVENLASEMASYGAASGKKNFDRDAENVRSSPVVVLLGLKDATPLGLNCGACGGECKDLKPTEGAEFKGPQCALRHLDLGIAIGSAARTAGIHNADNRIMYRIGVVARKIGLIDADFCMGIPLSATGKNIYFDRK